MKVSLNTLRRSWLGLASMGMVAAPLAIAPAAAQEAQIEVQVVAGEEGDEEAGVPREIEQLQAEMRRLREELSRRERDLAGALQRLQLDRAAVQREHALRMLEAAQLNREMHALLQAPRDGQVWLGVNTGTLTAEMKDELGLDDDVRGIVISSVVDDSPAQSAGLQVNDVIVAAGEAEIGDVAQLVKVVRDSDGESIVLRLIRDGEARDIEVTPAPRPAAFQVQDIRGAVLPGIGQGFDIDLAIGAEDGGDVSVPQNFSISIKREGDGPADVTVVYKGETYEVTSETIDMLPEEVQAPVRRTLRGLQGNGNVQVQRGFDLQLPQGVFPPADIRGNLPRGLRLPRLPEGVELPQGVEIDGDEARRIFLEVVPALQAIEVGDAIELQLQARRAAEAEAAAEVLDDQEGGVRAELDELRGELSEIKQLLKKLLEERE